MANSFDIVIIGAGVSGINAAQRIQTQLPGHTYTILEARHALGGTWDLFKYPGIRSDSDLYTFGFPWRLWSGTNAIADGPSIKSYLAECAASAGIDKHIQYHHKLISQNWSSKRQVWDLEVAVGSSKKDGGEVVIKKLEARFVIHGSGYYDYDEPLKAVIPGLERFQGTTIHPQFWPESLDYSDKKIVMIGSGATAVTLLPVLAKTAASVTMLQRSPTYILCAPAKDDSSWIRGLFPGWVAHALVRWKFMWGMWIYFQFCRAFPTLAKSQIRSATEKELPPRIRHDPHFKPTYNPWEQRLCLSPDGDFYDALRRGNAHVVTGTIATITETGVTTTSGQTIDADIIITATGLKMKFAGGARFTIDGTAISVPQKFLWKGALLQDVPNTAFLFGYTNASWTLGAEASIQLVCKIIKHMDATGKGIVVPKVGEGEKVEARSMMNLKSTYVIAGRDATPKAGSVAPWKPRTNYFKDFWNAKYGGMEGLVFEREIGRDRD